LRWRPPCSGLLTGTFRERLRETETHLGRIFEDAPVGILILDGGTRIRKVNPAFRQFLGTLPTADNEIADVVHADSQPQVRAFLDRLTHERAIANVAEIGFLNGPNLVWANLRGSRIQKDSGRAPISMVMAEDITERRRTEQALRETEARLHRGDRMEALGLLAGGLAHDFNNLLTVTFACCDNLRIRNDLSPESRRDVEEILNTVKMAADMTEQLVAFARRRPAAEPVVELNRVVGDTTGLLQRLIGSGIELKTELAPGAGAVRADPSQLQQVLMKSCRQRQGCHALLRTAYDPKVANRWQRSSGDIRYRPWHG